MTMLSASGSSSIYPPAVRSTSRRLVIVTSGNSTSLLKRISADHAAPFEVVRTVQLDDSRESGELRNDDLCPVALRRDRVWGIVVSSSDLCKLPHTSLLQCRINGINVLTETSFGEQHARWIDVDAHDPSWILSPEGFRVSRIEEARQRAFDLFIAFFLLVFALPLMVIVAALIKFDSAGPALYRQERVGLNGRRFTIFKFRSMREDAEAIGAPKWAEQDDPRITRVGRFIRFTRVDELPQLLNVLRGEMSIIGPRPERPYFVERLAAILPNYNARHLVKPGITGWAQVSAPYGASVDDARTKLRYDLYYIKHRGLWLDVAILLRTIRVILFRKGAR